MSLSNSEILQLDRQMIWHPYSSTDPSNPLFAVDSARGSELYLKDGRTLIDGMSSWWSCLHGYSHPKINEALKQQVDKLSHVMFGGLTHEPAARLAKQLIDLSPEGLDRVFFSDSGSVSVEVAMKMAIQFWRSQGHAQKTQFMSFFNGYHGDTLGAMSVCDPINGMHHLFSQVLPQQIFAPAPQSPFGQDCQAAELEQVRALLVAHHQNLAAIIIEPIVQGAGGMRFYSADFLSELRNLCDEFSVLLICDEIATGFGRTGRLFASEHAEICPDIMCLGKTLTGGYLSLAATLCSDKISLGICSGEAGVFMHGPTYMGNPLACTAASASIDLLLSYDWKSKVTDLEVSMSQYLKPALELTGVRELRCLGGIGVLELEEAVDMKRLQPLFVDNGVWVRPFGKLVYIMPSYLIDAGSLRKLCEGIVQTLNVYLKP